MGYIPTEHPGKIGKKKAPGLSLGPLFSRLTYWGNRCRYCRTYNLGNIRYARCTSKAGKLGYARYYQVIIAGPGPSLIEIRLKLAC